MRVSLSAGDPVGGFLARILKADLDVIKSGIDQRLQALLVQAEARSNEIGVEPSVPRSRDQVNEIGTSQRFAAGEVRMEHTELASLIEDADPLCSRKL